MSDRQMNVDVTGNSFKNKEEGEFTRGEPSALERDYEEVGAETAEGEGEG